MYFFGRDFILLEIGLRNNTIQSNHLMILAYYAQICLQNSEYFDERMYDLGTPLNEHHAELACYLTFLLHLRHLGT